jgi:hypothetical protein
MRRTVECDCHIASRATTEAVHRAVTRLRQAPTSTDGSKNRPMNTRQGTETNQVPKRDSRPNRSDGVRGAALRLFECGTAPDGSGLSGGGDVIDASCAGRDSARINSSNGESDQSSIPCQELLRLVQLYTVLEIAAFKTRDPRDQARARIAQSAVNGHIAEHGCWGSYSGPFGRSTFGSNESKYDLLDFQNIADALPSEGTRSSAVMAVERRKKNRLSARTGIFRCIGRGLSPATGGIL